MRLGHVAGMALLVPLAAQAQWTNPFTGAAWDNPLSDHLGAALLGNPQRRALAEQIRKLAKNVPGDAAQPARAARPKKPRHRPSATDFKSTGTRLISEKLAESAASDEQRARVREAVERGLSTFEQKSRKHNVAAALGLLVAAAAQVAYEREMAPEDLDAIVRLVNDGLAESRKFKRMKARSKQEIYESSIITGGLLAGLASQARRAGDEEAREQVRRTALQLLASLGIRQ